MTTSSKDRDRYEEAGKRSLLVLARCKRLFKGDGLYVPAIVRNDDVIVGWYPTKGFCVDLGDGELVLANNPLDAPRISAVLAAVKTLYDEACRLRDDHADLLDESSQAAENFLADVTKDREPEEEPPEWPTH